jgi:site-specific recombinase XerD
VLDTLKPLITESNSVATAVLPAIDTTKPASAESVNHFVVAARFLYNVTLEVSWPEDAWLRCRVPHRLPVVLSAIEMAEFFQHVCTIRYRAALMTAYGAGLRVSEVVVVQIGDIDSKRMLIRVRQGKGRKDRYAVLSPRLLEVLRCWFRSQCTAGERHHVSPADWLFPGGAKAAT